MTDERDVIIADLRKKNEILLDTTMILARMAAFGTATAAELQNAAHEKAMEAWEAKHKDVTA